MSVDIVQLYGPGMSYYLSNSNSNSEITDSFSTTSECSIPSSTTGSMASAISTPATSSYSVRKDNDDTKPTFPQANNLQSYSTSLMALQSSNEGLESRMTKLSNSVNGLNRDLLKLQRQVDSFYHESLTTWQADILTRLIEVAYARQRRKLPWGVAIGERETQDWEIVSRAYVNAAAKVSKKVLGQKLGLGTNYYEALRKYSEVSVLAIIMRGFPLM